MSWNYRSNLCNISKGYTPPVKTNFLENMVYKMKNGGSSENKTCTLSQPIEVIDYSNAKTVRLKEKKGPTKN